MSAQDIEERVRQLPPDELRRFAEWWHDQGQVLLSNRLLPESEAVKAELRRRGAECRDQPAQRERLDDVALDRMFRDIENEVP